MTTRHLTGTMHNGMLWSDRNDLELSEADRWTVWQGDLCLDMRNVKRDGNELKDGHGKEKGGGGKRMCTDHDRVFSCFMA